MNPSPGNIRDGLLTALADLDDALAARMVARLRGGVRP